MTNTATKTAVKTKNVFDFKKQLKQVEEIYPTLAVLDNDGKVINQDLMPDLSDDQLVELMKRMVWSRVLNDRSTALARQGKLGFFAPTEGQEASQLASSYAFEKEDLLYPGYRDIPQLIKHGLPIYKAFLWSRGHAEGNIYPEDLHAMPPQIIIGAQIIQAMGAALGLKKRGKKQVAFTYTGDGGSSQGDFYEGMNFAGSYGAPAVFFVQNNGYAISTPRRVQTAAPTIAQKAAAAGIPGLAVDGMDALAVYRVAKEARDWAVAGNGPVFIEIISNRFGPHSLSGDNPLLYRDKEDIDFWKAYDPLIRYRKFLGEKGLWNDKIEEQYIEEVNEEITAAVKEADSAPKQKVSDLLKNMFEEPGQVITEQIAYFEAKEAK